MVDIVFGLIGVYLLTLFIMTLGGFAFGGYIPFLEASLDEFPRARSLTGYFFIYWLPECMLGSLIIWCIFGFLILMIKLLQ